VGFVVRHAKNGVLVILINPEHPLLHKAPHEMKVAAREHGIAMSDSPDTRPAMTITSTKRHQLQSLDHTLAKAGPRMYVAESIL
jgi:hypothetical protein